MSEQIEIEIIVDDSQLKESKREFEDFQKESTNIIKTVEDDTGAAFNKVVSMARGSYLLSLGMIKAAGVSVTYFFRSMVSAAFSTVSMLKAISLGKAMTTQNWVQFGLEMAQLGLATAAIVAASMKKEDVSRGLMGAKMSLMGVQQLIGSLDMII